MVSMTTKRRIASSSSESLHHRAELLRVQTVELADDAVQRTDRDDGGGIEPARSEHRRERVESVPVGGDDLLARIGSLCRHHCDDAAVVAFETRSDPEHVHKDVRTSPSANSRCAARYARWLRSRPRAPLGNCEMPIVERAGARSPTTSFIAAKSAKVEQENRGLHELVQPAARGLEDR